MIPPILRRFSTLALLGSSLLLGCTVAQTKRDDDGSGGQTTSTSSTGGAATGVGGTGGGDVDVCDPYAPRAIPPEVLIGPTGLEQALVAQMDGAQSTLELSMYQLNRAPCINGLIAAQERGVTVRVQLDYEQEENANAITQLQGAGIEVRDAPNEFTHAHAKVMVVDGVRAVVMSANMNSYSMTSERNYGVVDHDPSDVEDLLAIFERDWAGTGPVDLSCTRLVVSPENARDRLVGLINGAQTSLDLEVMYLSDDDLLAAVKAKAQSGVPVRAMLAHPGWISDNTQTAAELDAAGVDARILAAWEVHAKLVIADGVAFVGSENLSWTSLTKNREVGLFVTEPDAAAQITTQYEQDWNQAIQN